MPSLLRKKEAIIPYRKVTDAEDYIDYNIQRLE
jgi:hypothetical protein